MVSIQTGYYVSCPTIELNMYFVYGRPVSHAFPDASTNTHTDSGSASPVRSLPLGESRLISFLGVLDVSVPCSPINLRILLMIVCRTHWVSIRKSPVITVHITHRRLSQISTSFIASDCQGIHRVRLVA